MPGKKELANVIKRLREMRDVWIIPYGPMWNQHHELRSKFYGTPKWTEKIVKTFLPGSKEKVYIHSPKEVCLIIGRADPTLMMNYLVVLCSLYDEIRLELEKNSSLQEKSEFILMKETRNCYVHNLNLADDKWVKAYRSARNTNPKIVFGERVKGDFPDGPCENLFQQIEIWHNLMLSVAERALPK